MDYRMKNFKESHLNYHSVVQLPRNLAASRVNEDRATNYKSKDYTVEISSPLPFLKMGKQNHSMLTQIQLRLDTLENRLQALENGNYRNNSKLENTRDYRHSFTSPSPTLQEFSLLKQTLQSELISHQEQLRASLQKQQKLQMRLGQIEQELRHSLNAQHQDMSMKWMAQKEEIKGQEYSRQSKNDQQMEALRYSINHLEERVSEERQRKAKEDLLLKQQVSRQIANAKEQFNRISTQERQQNQKWLKQLKQTLVDLKSTLETDRSQVREAINQLQNLSDHRFSILQKNIDTFSQGSIERTNKMDKKLASFKSQWITFKVNLEEKVEEHKTAILNIETRSLDREEDNLYEPEKEKMEDFKQEMKQWKRVLQQKNLNVFKEMANALKTMRLEWQSEQEDMGKQLSQLSKTITALKKTTRKQLKNDMHQIVSIMSEEFDVLTQQLQNVSDLAASAKRQLEQKLEQSCLKQIGQLKSLVENTVNSLKQQLSGQNSKIAEIQNDWRRSSQTERVNWKKQLEQAQNKQQTKLDNFIDSLNRQNQEWTSEFNLSIGTLRSHLTQRLQDNASSHSKQIDREAKKVDATIQNLKSEIQKGLETNYTTLKKQFEEALANQRSQTNKQISKASDELLTVITDSSNKQKKQREKLEKDVAESVEQAKKTAKTDISAVKITLDTKLAEIKSRQLEKGAEQQKKYSQLKSYVDQSLLKQEKNTLQELSKNAKRIDQVESTTSTIKKQLLIQVDKVTKDKLSDSKAKDEELRIRQLDLQKKVNDGLAKITKDVSISIQKIEKDISNNKIREEELKNKQLQFQKRFIESLGKIKSDLGGDLNKTKALLSDENNKWKAEIEARVKAGDEAKAKKQLDIKTKEQELRSKQAEFAGKLAEFQKKVDASLAALKKEIQKMTVDDLAKLKNQVDQRLKVTKNDSELKAKEDLEKKIQTLISISKREMQGVIVKDKKLTNDQIAKLQQEGKRLKNEVESRLKDQNLHQQSLKAQLGGKLEQVAKKQQALREELGRKMAEIKGIITVSTKSQQAEFNKLQDQRLQHLRADLSSQFTAKLEGLMKQSRALRGMVTEFGESSKEKVNQLQVGLFSEREKSKAMYEKLSKDLLEMTDNLGLIMSEVGVHN